MNTRNRNRTRSVKIYGKNGANAQDGDCGVHGHTIYVSDGKKYACVSCIHDAIQAIKTKSFKGDGVRALMRLSTPVVFK
jgi:hypothetical protein